VQQGSQNFQSVTDDVLSRRKTLRSQIAATTQQLQAATTDAETQKLTGVLVGWARRLGITNPSWKFSTGSFFAPWIATRKNMGFIE
jgi:hypothetical protein